MTRKTDPDRVHIRIYWDVIDSHAFLALGWTSQALYTHLRRKMMSTNNGNIEATLKKLRLAQMKSPSTLAKCLRELEAVGLIAKTRDTIGVEHGHKVCCLYRFTDKPMFDFPALGLKHMPATDEWRRFEKLADAKAAINAAHKAVVGTRPDLLRKKRTVQISSRDGTDSVPMASNIDTDFVPREKPSVRNSFRETATKSGSKSAADQSFPADHVDDSKASALRTKNVHLCITATPTGEQRGNEMEEIKDRAAQSRPQRVNESFNESSTTPIVLHDVHVHAWKAHSSRPDAKSRVASREFLGVQGA